MGVPESGKENGVLIPSENLPGKRLHEKVFVVHLKEIQIQSKLRLGGSTEKWNPEKDVEGR